jgi:VanZ family protein
VDSQLRCSLCSWHFSERERIAKRYDQAFLIRSTWYLPQALQAAHKLNPTWQKRHLGILCGIVIVAVLIATLWPLNFFPANRTSWLRDAHGIRFDSPGLVESKVPLIPEGNAPGKYCSLELLLGPARIEGSTTILGFYDPNNPSQFLVRQWTDGLIVSRDTANAQNEVKRTKFDVGRVFQPNKLVMVSITSGPNGTVVYLNGAQNRVFPRFRISQKDLSGQIVLGTSPIDYQPWQGEVRGLAIYSIELTAAQASQHYENWISGRAADSPQLDGAIAKYAFTEGAGRSIHSAVPAAPDLEIPRRFTVPHKALLKSPAKEFEASWDYFFDVLRNIAGFVPVGFILCAYWGSTRGRRQAVLFAILGGAVLSFVIELLQFYVPQRNSGITDIITNSLGAALGAVLARPSLVWTILERIKPLTA